MAGPRKFGAFGGVFTPAILTILGVIMYLRLPRIVGTVGFWAALGVIIVAHVVSVTTGLSVSSIATDKKVKAGGSYYIISRALGLPIGGTIGMALFVGLSFSVSLYLIGFSESMLATVLGRAPEVNEIRLAGSAALLTVTIVTFISTALAIKTQYIIMGLIVLSLASVLIGNPDFPAPEAVNLGGMPAADDLILVFGIFFPAVTGFEAGVSMSGDLRDPKRTIPKGTLTAIFVGLAVYIGLALFLSLRVPAEQLVGNKEVLLDMALLPQLVTAGIWGATISSAFGSILGAPRILQACAQDRIGPRFFGKGAGKDNEPRNALLLTFLIAEGGILIGELDAIARIVSMFFLASYAFLNLSAAIESWASPDFRPDFRIPLWVSVLGSATCLFLMIQLDVVSMAAAIVLMLLLFYVLRRKHLALEGGDTWNGVWSSLVRSGLERLSRTKTHQRNWRPNVLCFTDAERRDSLIQLGRALIDVRGVLTEFELVQTDQPRTLSIHEQTISDDEARLIGFFHRRVETDDAWGTIGSVARYHGMTGLEPNTVLTSWSQLRGDPERSSTLLAELEALDLNLVLAVNPRPVAKGHLLDVWWRGAGRNLALELALVRFVTNSEGWRQASVRFLAVTSDPSLRRPLEQRLSRYLQEARVDAEVRVFDAPDDEELETFSMRISAEADVTILGLSAGSELDAAALSAALDSVSQTRQSALVVRAAASFADPFPELESLERRKDQATREKRPRTQAMRPATIDLHDEAAEVARHSLELHDSVGKVYAAWHDEVPTRLSESVAKVVDDIGKLADRALAQIERAASAQPRARRERAARRAQRGALDALDRALCDLEEGFVDAQREIVEVGVGTLTERLKETIALTDEVVHLEPPDGVDWRGFWSRLFGRPMAYGAPAKRWVSAILEARVEPALEAALGRFTVGMNRRLSGLDGLVAWALESFAKSRRAIEQEEAGGAAEVAAARAELSERLAAWHAGEEQHLAHELEAEANLARDIGQRLSDLLADPTHDRPGRPRRTFIEGPVSPTLLTEPSQTAFELQAHVLRRTCLDVALRRFHQRIREMERQAMSELSDALERGVLADAERLDADLDRLAEALAKDPDARLETKARLDTKLDERRVTEALLAAVEAATEELPEAVHTLTDASLTALAEGRGEDVEPVELAVRRVASLTLEAGLAGQLQDELTALGAASERLAQALRDAVRLLTLSEAEADRDRAREQASERLELIASSRERIATERGHVERAWKLTREELTRRAGEVIEDTRGSAMRLSPKRADELRKTKERQRPWTRLAGLVRGIRRRGRRLLINFLFRWSRWILRARQIRKEEEAPASPIERVLALRQASAPRQAVRDALPIFYRQIFTGRAAEDPAYWLPQEDELQRAARAIEAHREGHPGALLVAGPPGAGRASLVRRIARAHYPRDRTFTVRAPEGGSADPARFDEALLAALGLKLQVRQALETLPPDTLIVVPNVELWWERRPGGTAVIERLEELVESQGVRCLFLLSGNEHALGLLRRLGRLNAQIIATVPCRPLDAEALRECVMLRHRASGLKLRLEGRQEEPNDWEMARIFAGLSEYSAGAVGAALTAWIGHIVEVSEETVVLRRPRAVEVDAIGAIDPEWLAVLVEVTLHRQLTLTRLERVTGQSRETLGDAVAALRRAGLIVEADNGVLELDPWMRPHTLRALTASEVL